MPRIYIFPVIQLSLLVLICSCHRSGSSSSSEDKLLNQKLLKSPVIVQNNDRREIQDLQNTGKAKASEEVIQNKAKISPARIMVETYPSFVKAREACSNWTSLGMGGQLIDVVEHSNGPDSTSRESSQIVVKEEKRVCDANLMEPRVIGSYIVDKDGTSLKIIFKEFRY